MVHVCRHANDAIAPAYPELRAFRHQDPGVRPTTTHCEQGSSLPSKHDCLSIDMSAIPVTGTPSKPEGTGMPDPRTAAASASSSTIH